MLGTKQKTEVKFEEVNSTGVFMLRTGADQEASMRLLQQNGLVPVDPWKAPIFINRNQELKDQLKGSWFYTAGKGLKEGGLHTFNDEGKYEKGGGDQEKTIYLWKGNNPLSIGVRSDYGTSFYFRRYVLYAANGPQGVASVVVGVKPGHEVAALKSGLRR